jgi:Tol biopolymer transport system component
VLNRSRGSTRRIPGLAAILILTAGACTSTPAPTPTSASVLPASLPPSALPSPSLALLSAEPSVAPTPPTGMLLYQAMGAAWLLSTAGGESRRLGPAVTAAWSADGRLIHLVSQGATCVPRLTTVTPSGEVVSVIKTGLRAGDAAFAWSPDGRTIVFVRYRNGAPSGSCGSKAGTFDGSRSIKDIRAMNADGTGQHVAVPQIWPIGPIDWSRDGTRIAFAADVPPTLDKQDVCIVRHRDGLLRHINADPFGGVSGPLWSPDQKLLSVTLFARRTLDVIRADTGDVRRIGNVAIHQQPTWSPDGAWLEAMSEGPAGAAGAAIGLWPIAGGTARDLGVTDAQAGAALPPSWSPDGRWIAYVRAPSSAGGPAGISVVLTDATFSQPIAETDGAGWVAWQPAP